MVTRFGARTAEGFDCEHNLKPAEDGEFVDHIDYATLAAAARRLVEAVLWKVEVGEYYDFCVMMDDALDTDSFSTGNEIEEIYQSASRDYLVALAEVEALL